VASVSEAGQASGLSSGIVQIRAEAGGVDASAQLTVKDPPPPIPDDLTIQVTPHEVSLDAIGATAQLTWSVSDDLGNPAPEAEVVWSSLNPLIAEVDGSGVVTAKTVGSALVVASLVCCESADTVSVNVDQVPSSIVIFPEVTTVNRGSTVQFLATVLDRNGHEVPNPEVTWSSDEDLIAAINQEGVATGLSEGETQIRAEAGAIAEFASLTVEDHSMPVPDPGMVQDLAVMDVTETTVTLRWTQVDDGEGNPASYSLRYGTPTISWGAAYPTEVSLEGSGVGSSLEYTWTEMDSGTDYQFQLVSYRGTLNQDAVFGNLSNKADARTATPPPEEPPAPEVGSVVVSPAEVLLTAIGENQQLTVVTRDPDGVEVTGMDLEWISLDSSVVQVDSEGLLTSQGQGNGLVVVTATCCAVSDTAQVTVDQAPDRVVVSPASKTLEEGESHQFSAVTEDRNGHVIPGAEVTWASADEVVASVDAQGLVTALAEGTTQIRAETEGIVGEASLTVTAPYSPPPPSGDVLVFDGFESGDFSHTENGFNWGQGVRTNVKMAADGFPIHSGTYSMKFRHPADSEGKDPWAEQRFDFGQVFTEVWIEYVLRFPSDYVHGGSAWGNNNKFFVLWDSGNYPGGGAGQISYFLETRSNGSGGSHLLFCQQDEDYQGGCGGAMARNTAAEDFITGSDLDSWITIRMHAKVATADGIHDGRFEMWKDGVKIFDYSDLEWYDPDVNGFQKGYILGWANSGFPVSTHTMLDRWTVYVQDPGW
jgi:uncharacterized protein YjdB